MANIESIIWTLILLDAIGANIVMWIFPKWYSKKFKGPITKLIPESKLWATIYLAMTLWVGYALFRLGILNF